MNTTLPSGPSLPAVRLVYGCWRLSGSEGEPVTPESVALGRTAVLTALEAGYTGFDLADIYGGGRCEEIFGQALRDSSADRSHLYLATKCSIRRPGEPKATSPYRYDASREYIVASVDGSLRRLGVESVDLLMLHRPDYLLDPDEVASAFAELQQAGKVRQFGVSNFRPSQVALLKRAWSQPLVTHQIEISLWAPDAFDDGRLDQCQSDRMTPMAWSPMAKGVLGDSPLPALLPADKERAARLRTALSDFHPERLVGALAWLLRHPAGIVPVIGTTSPHRIRAARQALAVNISRDDWYRWLELARGSRLP